MLDVRASFQLPVSSFQLPVSSFQFPVSSYTSNVTVAIQPSAVSATLKS
jgi:hypothetical protein